MSDFASFESGQSDIKFRLREQKGLISCGSQTVQTLTASTCAHLSKIVSKACNSADQLNIHEADLNRNNFNILTSNTDSTGCRMPDSSGPRIRLPAEQLRHKMSAKKEQKELDFMQVLDCPDFDSFLCPSHENCDQSDATSADQLNIHEADLSNRNNLNILNLRGL